MPAAGAPAPDGAGAPDAPAGVEPALAGAEETEVAGVRPPVLELTVGAETAGAETDGALTDGALTDGALAVGVLTDGALAVGV
ncbi:MAG: hypothetical protein ACXVVU_26455, partial [Solirubrobacteraceae bacterium]